MDTVFLLPGQGGYKPGLFAQETSPDVAEVLRVVDRVAGEFGRSGVSRLLLDVTAPSAAELVRTDSFALQLAVFAAGLGSYRIAEARCSPDVLVGHSMGEIAALTAAGAFDTADGARIVCHRAEALLAHSSKSGGMVALELTAARAKGVADAVAVPGLGVAVINAPRQTVLSGPDEAVAKVLRLADALDVQATQLNAPFAFHSPLLRVAAEEFGAAITEIRQRPLRRRVYSPVAGGYLTDDTDMASLLVRQLTAPVHFLNAVRELHASGAGHFVECGNAGLSGLVRRSVPDVTTDSTVEARSETVVGSSVSVGVVSPVGVVPDVGVVLEQLRELYASTLGYPVEAITGDADLEADLGVDSLKRAEMLGRVTARFGLGDSAGDVRFIAQPTLGELADLVVSVKVAGR
ncbi:MAG: acyltransferase domain-containing protein [Actinomycetota bacterium]|nr:acyltransferase domain-containing protein [Actinomycetota bacterium]